MKIKLSFDEAFEVSELLVNVLKSTLPKELRMYEMRSLFMLKKMGTNNLKEIKEKVIKEIYDIPKKILEVKIAKVIARLISLGLVRKEKCAEDKRQVLVFITPKGDELLDRVLEETREKWKEVTNG